MVSDRFIVCQKKEGTRARALLDRMSETSSPHTRDWEISSQELNSLAKRGYISFETDRYGLIFLIADFFLSQKAPFEALSVDPIEQKQRWEAHLLQKLQEEVPPSFYEKVLSLKEIHGGFLGDFSKDLLAYIETHYEEASNYRALKKFALNSAVFPWITDLLWNTLKADEAHQRWIEEKGASLAGEDPLTILSQVPSIPTIEEIVTVLDAAEQKITELSAHTVSQEVSLLQTQQIIEFLFPEEEELFKLETATTFQEKISEALNSEMFKERGEVRLHKGQIDLPFSLWVQKESQKGEGIVVSILGQPLGDGEFKKVKGLTQFFVPANSSFPISVSSAALLRIRQGGAKESERGDLIQRETFRRVPLAHDYFASPAKKHVSHEGRFSQKLEWEAPWYSGDLNTFIKAMALPSKIGGEKEPLRWIDLIRCLKHVTSGVRLLEEAAIFHRDLSSANIFIKKQEDSSWTAHIADFDRAKDMSGLKNELMSEEEFFERKSDRYNLVTLILGALTEKMGVYFSGLELETLDETIAECRFRVFKKRESFFQKLGMDPALEDRALLAIAKDRPYAQTVEIKRFVATLCFFDQVVGLFEKTHRSASRMEDLEKEYLREGLSYRQAQQRSFIDTGFPSFEEIEAVLTQCESVAQDYDL